MYLPNPDVGPTGYEMVEFLDAALLSESGPKPPARPEDHDPDAAGEQEP